MFLLLFFRIFVCLHSIIVVATSAFIVCDVNFVDFNDGVDDFSNG